MARDECHDHAVHVPTSFLIQPAVKRLGCPPRHQPVLPVLECVIVQPIVNQLEPNRGDYYPWYVVWNKHFEKDVSGVEHQRGTTATAIAQVGAETGRLYRLPLQEGGKQNWLSLSGGLSRTCTALQHINTAVHHSHSLYRKTNVSVSPRRTLFHRVPPRRCYYMSCNPAITATVGQLPISSHTSGGICVDCGEELECQPERFD